MPAPQPASRLHRKIQYPYYVYAPDYRESSSGIQSLHYLCHALNLEGAKAYMVGCQATHPDLQTPLLTEAVRAQHESLGLAAIAVYPEIVTGNPLSAPVVVRYMLNREGVLNGNAIEAGPDDLRFYFRQEFYDEAAPGDFLRIPMVDIGMFSPDPVQAPALSLLYLNRVPREAVDFSRIPAHTQILSMHNPLPLAELAKLLRKARVLYSYEQSSTCSLAVFCGCPVVCLTAPGYEKHANTAVTRQELGGGMVWSDDEASLAQARQEVDAVRAKYLDSEALFWEQLQNFLAKTQWQASRVRIKPPAQVQRLRAWQDSRTPNAAQSRLIDDHLAAHAGGPSFCVVVRDRQPGLDALQATLSSAQPGYLRYQSLQLHVLTSKPLDEVASLARDGVQIHAGIDPQDFAAACNRIAAQAGPEWLIFTDAGDTFTPSGLRAVALELMCADSCQAAYADAIAGDGGQTFEPILRPAFNLDLLLSCPVSMSRHWIFRRSAFLRMNGFDAATDDAQEFDLLLRLIETEGMEGLGHVSETLLTMPPPQLQTTAAEVATLQRHLQSRGYDQAEIDTRLPGRYRIRYGHGHEPLVSLVIEATDDLALLQRCLESVLEKTSYGQYEVLLLDSAGTAPNLRSWLDELGQLGHPRVRIVRAPQATQRSAAQNEAAQQAGGEYLVFLRHDTAVLHGSWLQELLNHAQRPEVGIVGAKLLSPDGRILHAGLVLGLNGAAGTPFAGLPHTHPGYMHRLEVDQNYSAVSGDCLMVRRALYDELGGMDAQNHPALLADIHLCLQMRQAGYLIVWTPHCVLLQGSENRQAPGLPAADELEAIQHEESHLYRNWLPVLAHDAAYNQSLSLHGNGFEVETDTSIHRKPLPWRPQPVVLAVPADRFGCGHYRMIHPVHAMHDSGIADARITGRYFTPEELERLQPDTLVLQRQVSDEQLMLTRRLMRLRPTFLVAELDDYLPNLPMKNAHREHMPKDILRALRRSVGLADRFVVSTEPLAEALAGLNPDTRVVLNRLPPAWWRGLQSSRRVGARPRVGWAGGASHQGDLELIIDVVKELRGEVDWVFFGMCPEQIRPYLHEFHGPVSIERYPATLARLNLDLALAPLEQNLFNECKSNLRLLEYGACGYPVIASDVRPYQGGLPVTLVKNRFKDWVDAIRAHTRDLDAAAAAGDRLKAQVEREWMLEGAHVQHWLDAWMPS